MNEKSPPGGTTDFLDRLQRLETELNRKEDEIRLLRQELREVESSVWASTNAAQEKPAEPTEPVAEVAQPRPPAKPAMPPPLPPDVAVLMGSEKPVPPPEEEEEAAREAEPLEEAAPALRIELPEEVLKEAALPRVDEPVAEPRAPEPAAEPVAKDSNLETRIGGVWFNRIGLVILIIGFALMARLIVPNLQPWMKLAAMYLASFALLGAGLFFDRRYPTFARPVTAGALALAFFASFAGHYIEATACLSLPLSLIFMFVSTLCVLLFAEKWDSEPTAGLAVFLGHVAAYVGGVEAGTVPLVAILILTATAAVLFVRHRWQPLSLFAVAAAFLSHALWYVRDHGAQGAAGWFWLNFAFLTSYYVCFQLADLLLRREARDPKSETRKVSPENGPGDEGPAAGMGGVGPVAMVLYSATAVWLFFDTGVYWSSVHLFLLPFAALQAGLTILYFLRRKPTYPLYAVAAVLFAALGLFAWLDGLTLTLTLAVEGLVVMVLARREGFRFLYPVSQLVLGAGFVHYWTWGAEAETSWPALLANLTAAVVFLLAAYLEERWPKTKQEESRTSAAFLVFPRNMAALHAIGGGVMAAHLIGVSLPAPTASLTFTLAILFLLVSALSLRARCWAWPIWILQLRLTAEAFLLSVESHPRLATPSVLADLWYVHQALALAVTAAGASAVLWGLARRHAYALVTGAGMLVLGFGFPVVALHTGQPGASTPAMLLAIPFLYGVLGAVGRREITDWRISGGWLAPAERAVASGLGTVRSTLACLGAILLSVGLWQVYPAGTALLYLSATSGVLLLATVLLDAPALAAGLMLHSVLMMLRMVWGAESQGAVFAADVEVNWAFLACILPALGLTGGAWLKRRASFVLAARTLLACFVFGGLGAKVVGLDVGRPLWLWLGSLVAAWVLLEALCRFLADPHRSWRDRFGLRYLQATSNHAGLFYALALAVLHLLVLQAYFGMGIQLCWALLASAVVLAAGALALRSPRLALANTLAVAAAFAVLLVEVGLERAVVEHPAFVVCLALLTLGQGLCAEIIVHALGVTSKSVSWRVSLTLLCVLYYVAGLALTLVSIDLRLAADTPYVMAAQSSLLLVLFLVGMGLRAPFLTWFTLAASGLVLLVSMGRITAGPEAYRVHLLPSSLATAVQLVLMERLLSRPFAAFLDRTEGRLVRACRIAVVVAVALLLVFACLFAAGVQGYLTTLGWSVAALILMTLGFMWKDRAYRYTALTLFLLSIGRVVLVDISGLGPGHKVAAFICLGACLLAVSFLYTRFKGRIQKWL